MDETTQPNDSGTSDATAPQKGNNRWTVKSKTTAKVLGAVAVGFVLFTGGVVVGTDVDHGGDHSRPSVMDKQEHNRTGTDEQANRPDRPIRQNGQRVEGADSGRPGQSNVQPENQLEDVPDISSE